MDLEHIHRVGIAAAYKGAGVLRSHLGKISQIGKKGDIDLVTEADLESEKQIISTIQKTFANHSILAEESGLKKGGSEHRWLIDPLDGTTNYAHQLPIFAISIAFALKDEILVGIVLNPVNGELFSAIRGSGAQLNGKPIRVSSTEQVSESLLVTGFPYNIRELFDMIMARYSRCLWAARGVRRLGSAALDLCYVACGRFEGFWEQGLKPWDTAAGSLVAAEAGARVTDFSNQPFRVGSKHILATNGRIHEEMLTLLRLKDGE
jgi:myo-inositol-1(or 4)-monophosphatase